MRDLGRQPLASANLTVITTANVSMKAHSAVQKWALLLKDALEQAWVLTCKWLKRTDARPSTCIPTSAWTSRPAPSSTRCKAQGRRRHLQEPGVRRIKRRGVLSDDADWDEDQEQMATELEGENLQPEKMIDPVTGQPFVVHAAARHAEPAAANLRLH
jgi:hypothetical protein